MKILDESGPWPWPPPALQLPAVITIEGREYRHSRVSERREGVLAQYRENRRRNARHLFVVDEGRAWRVDHVDAWNPHAGPLAALLHFFIDHPLGQTVRGAK